MVMLDAGSTRSTRSTNLLEVEGLRKWFRIKRSILDILHGKQEGVVKAVDDVSFSVKQGSTFVLAGESGSGKSTIARLILRAIEPDGGSIRFAGRDVLSLDKRGLMWFRRSAQMIHQDPYSSLNPRMKVISIVGEPLEVHGIKDRREKEEMVFKALEEVRLEPVEEIAYRYPHMLSGGQRQRVAIARALVLKPMLIVADEPVSMLDLSVRAEILELMQNLKVKHNITYIYITHDLSTARYFGDSIAILYKGKIVEMGSIDDVLNEPLHPYTQALIDAIPEPDPASRLRDKVIRIRASTSISMDEANDHGCRFYARCPYAMDICREEPKLLEVKNGHLVSCFLYKSSV
ncbi:ABC transporter ATP-binding protein [Candidatus Nitrosocaldus islandicus]|uniref:Oligopeptide transport ATP-binding protein AppF n=2 Tax=Candidatus Nitrosocaldus cavascurensis TaxID=2058097 RepID=A0A2K5AS19_9ARCH|nr:ABC transporter ATP-binding protein [Candidatus Nitrosocaldus islandicus]SPC34394.1 Oligopeptide transport ATP-binding protein AppF [Candidatus Nitrosocaldus cavascurensis]